MPEHQLSRSRKRQRSRSPEPPATSQAVAKKQRLGRHRPESLEAFWDSLSKVHLTKRALQELDRRNSQAASSPPRSVHRRARRPVTRSFLAERKTRCQTAPFTDNYPHSCGAKILKKIEQFARRGGPDLSGLRNYTEPPRPSHHAMSSTQSSLQSRRQSLASASSTRPTTTAPNTRSTGPYDRGFQQNLIDNGIYPNEYEYPDGSVPAEADNLEELNQTWALPRPSLSPSRYTQDDFRKLRRAEAHSSKEKQVSETVLAMIEGDVGNGRCRSGDVLFTNLEDLTDAQLTRAKPDVYYGARPEQLGHKVRDDLSGQIIPSTQHDLPMAPNFFLEAKGPDGSAAVAKRQASYNGALGARGMHALQSYGQNQPVHNNNAYTVTSTYHDGQLRMYTTHMAAPRTPGGRPAYYMNQVNTWGMTGNIDTFRQGATAYRNARDWAKAQRDEAIKQANERVNREAQPATDDGGASPALSFVTAVSETEAYTMSQQSQTTVNENSGIQSESEESESSVESIDYKLSAKRSGTRSKHAQTQPKRRNTDSTSQESWSWSNGKYQCYKGQDVVKEQKETPADVWTYFSEGWPGQKGKKWRLWRAATQEILYR